VTQKTSKRRTSKLLLGVNTVLAWAAIYFAIAMNQAAAVVTTLVGVILAGYGIYTGIGHLDLRVAMSQLKDRDDPVS
jgi:hypothetical protein